MKRYLVFAGEKYYPSGGAADYVMSFSRRPEAESYCRTLVKRAGTWCHMWDTKLDKVEEFYDPDPDY